MPKCKGKRVTFMILVLHLVFCLFHVPHVEGRALLRYWKSVFLSSRPCPGPWKETVRMSTASCPSETPVAPSRRRVCEGVMHCWAAMRALVGQAMIGCRVETRTMTPDATASTSTGEGEGVGAALLAGVTRLCPPRGPYPYFYSHLRCPRPTAELL